MNNIKPLDPAQATGKAKQLFDAIKAKLGKVPNTFRVIGNSAAALEGYINLSAAVETSILPARVREANLSGDQ